jgi:single-strand DNA-binding protein
MAQGAAIEFAGTLGDDPEMRFTAGGMAVANLSVAVSERKLNNAENKWEDAGTTWFRVTAWNKLAENAAESLRKGDRVTVTGTIRTNEYENREGEKRLSWVVTADDIGVSLKFNPAAPKRAERARPEPAGHDDPWAAPEEAAPAAASPAPRNTRTAKPAARK